MEKIAKETFIAWVTECNWFMINDVPTPMGQQCHYVTPAGEIAIVQFDLENKLIGYSLSPRPMPPQPQHFPGLDLLGGQHRHP